MAIVWDIEKFDRSSNGNLSSDYRNVPYEGKDLPVAVDLHSGGHYHPYRQSREMRQPDGCPFGWVYTPERPGAPAPEIHVFIK